MFDRFFGPERPGVCAVGFEPNPVHDAYLGKLNAWFEARGHPAYIFTGTGVSNREMQGAEFFRVRGRGGVGGQGGFVRRRRRRRMFQVEPAPA